MGIYILYSPHSVQSDTHFINIPIKAQEGCCEPSARTNISVIKTLGMFKDMSEVVRNH